MRSLLILFIPAGLLALAFHYAPELAALPRGQREVIELAPLVTSGLGLLLAMRFNRGRVFFVLLAVALAHGTYVGLERFAPTDVAARVSQALALVLPLSVLAFAAFEEHGVLTLSGRLRFILVAALGLALGWVAQAPRPEVRWVVELEAWAPGAFTSFSSMPRAALLLVPVGTLLVMADVIARPSPESGAFAGTFAAAVWTVHQAGDPLVAALFLGAAGLMLSVSVVETSYRMAYLDELTGLPGRRALTEDLKKLGASYALAMVDVDRFKHFNDRFGHDAGDEVLRMVAGQLERTMDGRAYRYGGEEFCVLFPGADKETARTRMEEVRATIADKPFILRQGRGKGGLRLLSSFTGRKVRVTVSAGVAATDGREKVAPWDLLKTADKALYRAKRNGRNRVC